MIFISVLEDQGYSRPDEPDCGETPKKEHYIESIINAALAGFFKGKISSYRLNNQSRQTLREVLLRPDDFPEYMVNTSGVLMGILRAGLGYYKEFGPLCFKYTYFSFYIMLTCISSFYD